MTTGRHWRWWKRNDVLLIASSAEGWSLTNVATCWPLLFQKHVVRQNLLHLYPSTHSLESRGHYTLDRSPAPLQGTQTPFTPILTHRDNGLKYMFLDWWRKLKFLDKHVDIPHKKAVGPTREKTRNCLELWGNSDVAPLNTWLGNTLLCLWQCCQGNNIYNIVLHFLCILSSLTLPASFHPPQSTSCWKHMTYKTLSNQKQLSVSDVQPTVNTDFFH